MITLLLDQLSRKEAYNLLSGSIVPRPIAFITSLSKENVVNAAPFSFFNVISGHPPLIAVSIGRRDGQMKDTAQHIIHKKEFVVHVSDEDMIEDINETAATLPREESELDRTGLHQVESHVISVPGIKEARIRFECQLEKHLTFQNDEGEITVDHIIGRVVCAHLDEAVYDAEKGYVSTNELKPVARLAGNDYAHLGTSFVLKRPQ
ncbi:flavin reductase family protein [Bacillus pumilus]|uniref:flavin reductase family protein n=1 Tax=Bacillus safensis TaxID=561879 RepID=UPI003837E0D0|nr:flavin reductase family protein [Bacillus pumilus]